MLMIVLTTFHRALGSTTIKVIIIMTPKRERDRIADAGATGAERISHRSPVRVLGNHDVRDVAAAAAVVL